MPAYSLGTTGAWAVTTHTDQILTGSKNFRNGTTWSHADGTVLGRFGGAVPSLFMAGYGSFESIKGDVGYETLVVKGMASQTASLLSLKNSANTVLTRFGPTGTLFVDRIQGQTTPTNLIEPRVSPNSTNAVAMVVQGLASQTSNLQEWRNSAGTPMVYVTPSGKVLADSPGTGASDFGFEVKKAAGGKAINLSNYTDVDFQVILPAPDAADKVTLLSGSTNTPIALGGAMVERFRFNPDGGMLVKGNGYVDVGPNTQYSTKVRLGGSDFGGGTGMARVAVTNGNLHIDPATGGYLIYLGWRASGFGGTVFGNGADAEVGRMTSAGAMTASSFTSTSTLESKRDVKRLSTSGPDDDKLLSLGAVSYTPAADPNGKKLFSFVAEEAAEVMPEIVSVNENNEITGINLTSLVTILTTQVQNLTARVRELEAAQ